MRCRRLAFLLFACCLLLACHRAPLHRQEAFVFGTRVEILLAGVAEPQARPAAAAVLREFDRLHRSYHAWQPSQLTAVNDAVAAGRAASVTSELAALIVDAQRLSLLGEHLFDPGIGRLIRLWGFHGDELPTALPDAAAVAAWRNARPGIADLEVDGQQVRSRKPGVALDFGGYLKGVALDRAAAILQAQGIGNALVNIGGNVLALGSKNGEPWRVGIQHPRQPGPLAAVVLNDGEAVGTSGDYQRFIDLDGRRYCHLLDPRSGEPVQHTQALTVLITPRAAAGTFSDFASKPLFIAGDDWPRLAQRLQVEHVLRVDAHGRLQVSAALLARLEFVGERPPHIDVVR